MTLYYPELIRGVFSLCVPYSPPRTAKVSLEQLATVMPHWKYQLQHLAPFYTWSVFKIIRSAAAKHLSAIGACLSGGREGRLVRMWSYWDSGLEKVYEQQARPLPVSASVLDLDLDEHGQQLVRAHPASARLSRSASRDVQSFKLQSRDVRRRRRIRA